MSNEIVVVTGAGGMGTAVARRIGSGRTLLLADAFVENLDRAVEALRAEGHDAHGHITDIADQGSVAKLAETAAGSGRVAAVVHTAGVSAATSTVRTIMEVDLAGTAYLIDAFEAVATSGTAVVCVASMAGHYAQLSPADEQALATEPADRLLESDVVTGFDGDPVGAYILAKRANQVRVQAAALAYNRRGARINSLSPGVIATAMAKAEQESASGDHMMAMLQSCGIGRAGTPAEIAEAVAFLTGPGSLYVTGTDLLIDGGQAAWLHRHRPR
ncbi:SDR family oxidoreductase [Actinoplanes sichuanensis]|uniref:SDR family oxidoreductase n=1 Tax=Actinoplanes sichuanensis TaxID=512349 RepID=A0ABW4AR44_9ACTN|nr:SDR family oxidoreductase [Actinoplanes sichuanensis]BEL07373.1 SDR family oxidoreductase [Actinoplanes sichuanensis]